MNLLRNGLFKSVGIYVVTNVINAAIPFFLLPFLTNHLSQADMGIVGVFNVLISFLLPLIGLNSNSAVVRFYYDDEFDYRKIVASALFLQLLSVIPIGLIGVLFADSISEILNVPVLVLFLAILMSLNKQWVELLLSLFRVKQEEMKFGGIRILNTILDLSLSLFLILVLKMGWEGRLEGRLIGMIITGVLSLIILFRKKWVDFKIDKSLLKQVVIFSTPLIFHTIGAVIINLSDQLIIANKLGIENTGLYYVGYQFGFIISVIETSVNQAWTPWLFKTLKEGNDLGKKKVVKITYGYIIGLIGLALLIYLSTPLLYSLFIGKEFDPSQSIVLWVLIGYAFSGTYKMFVGYLFYLKKTVLLSILTMSTAILNIVLNFILIPIYGIEGAAIATCISFLCQFIVTWVVASFQYKMPWLLR